MKYINFLLVIFLFSGCIKDIPTPSERKNSVLSLATTKNFDEIDIFTSTFSLFSLQKPNINCQNKNLKVYIEGDGLAWLSRTIISKNPTPLDSTIIKLIFEDNSECKVYLARPCQYIDSNICNNSFWTNKRFSDEVIKSFDESLNILKTKYKNKNFTLIGHSGGGAVATILASKRKDVDLLITIAGNLDIEKWTTMHKISKLEGSLNPADFSKNLENVKQYHLIGTKDKIIPKDIFLSYYSKFSKKDNIKYKYFNAEHNCCWEDPYKKILEELK